MTRVVVVFHLGGVGGPTVSLLPVVESLARNGTQVDCLVPADEAWVAEHYAGSSTVTRARYAALASPRRLADAPRFLLQLVRDVRRFRAAFRSRRADLVIVVTTYVPAALLAARLARVPVALYAAELHDQPFRRSRLRTMGRTLALAAARRADAIVCCSEAVAGQFPADPRVTVSYPPVAEQLVGGDRGRGREALAAGDGEPMLAVVGTLSTGRAQDVAIRALPLVRRSVPGARLVLVGDPHPRPVDLEYAAGLRALASELGVAEAVVFAGASDAMADVYAAADVVVNPARIEESFGRVAAEALMAGRPVVATDVGAVREVIRHERTGLLVPPDDPAAIARAAVRLLEDPELCGRLVREGRNYVRARFSTEEGVASWLRALPLPQ